MKENLLPPKSKGVGPHLRMLTGDGPELACTLDDAEAGRRISEWQSWAGQATSRASVGDGVRMILPPTADLRSLADLVTRERTCCTFLSFALVVTPMRVVLDVSGPPGSGAVIGALLGD